MMGENTKGPQRERNEAVEAYFKPEYFSYRMWATYMHQVKMVRSLANKASVLEIGIGGVLHICT